MCQISNRGGGISQAFGTGGRDVKEAIGGRMMLSCLELLENDDHTDVIVIVSKPPGSFPYWIRSLLIFAAGIKLWWPAF